MMGTKQERNPKKTVISYGYDPKASHSQDTLGHHPTAQMGFLLQPAPWPLSTAVVRASWGPQVPGQQACSVAGMHGPGRTAQARGWCRPGCQGCRRPERPAASPGTDRPPCFFSRAWLASSPHLRHFWRGCQETAQAFQPRTSRGSLSQVLASQRLLVEPRAGLN